MDEVQKPSTPECHLKFKKNSHPHARAHTHTPQNGMERLMINPAITGADRQVQVAKELLN
jgi:hypothetical protein